MSPLSDCPDHGPHDGTVCPYCESEALSQMAQADFTEHLSRSPVLSASHPGAVPVREAEASLGEEEFEYLTTTGVDGPDVVNPFLTITDAGEVERAKALCRYHVLDLAERIAVSCAATDLSDFRLTTAKSLCCLLANAANRRNAELRFATYPHTGDPWRFSVHDMLLAPSGRGKGIALAFFRNLVGRPVGAMRETAVQVEETVGHFSIPGFFGGVREGKNGALTQVEGVIQRSKHGVIQMPEFGDIRSTFKKEPAAIGIFAEWMDGGKFRYDLLKGHSSYQSYAYLMGACQPQMWEEVNDQVTNLPRRVVFSRLPPRLPEEEAIFLRLLQNGHTLDETAVAVLQAKIQRIMAEFRPTQFDARPVYGWLAQQVEHPPEGTAFASELAQPYTALALGYHLATGGDFDGSIVLSYPDDHPLLHALLLEDAETRFGFSAPPEEATSAVLDRLFVQSRFFGTVTKPVERHTAEVIAFISQHLKVKGTTARNIFYGYRENPNSTSYPPLVGTPEEPGVLQQVDAPKTLLALKEKAKRTRGRPKNWYVYNWGYR
ncbi:MAG: hypothetical protein KGI98_15675 [Euryarchaeota archaeon]|nr:hypothetical protein [Euryarchaeota archaeon]MDE1879474.1 hypothetical protein [Euryarchaeota archaeon]